MGIAHQRAADALAAILTEETGQRWIGVVRPEQDRRDAEKLARWERHLVEEAEAAATSDGEATS